jgi:cell division protein FtsL
MPSHAPARRRHTHAGGRRAAVAPRHPRRVSGPLVRPLPAAAGHAATLPRRGGTGVFERLRALPEHRMVDRLLRGRAWIWLIGVMLGGIVAMQVSLLQLNAGISRAVEQSSALERENADLEAAVAQLSSGERIQAAAAQEDMVTPPAGEVAYLTARPDIDAARAVAHMQPPSDEARAVMDNGGWSLEPVVPAVAALPQAPASTEAAPPVAAPAAPAAPAATAAPVAEQPVTAAADPGTGATPAPLGG